MSGLGPSFMKIWISGSSRRSGSRNAWKRIKKVNSARLWNFFCAIQLISCSDWWPWTKRGYITMTRRQINNQWSGGIKAHPAPKIPSAKIRWKSSRLDFLGSRRHPPHWLSSKGPNYQRGVLFVFAGAIEGYFEGKTPREVHQGILFLHDNAPAQLALTTQKKLAYLSFQCLDHPPYFPDLTPSNYHLFPGLKKIIESSPFFVQRGGHCCRGDLGGRTTFWIFLNGLQTLEQRDKKCIELRGDHVE